ncbi:MAG: PEP-CTERM sorting domain-containing protein [Anaerolineae bacterium]|nr:PEP-CTERM sorting domain-containing protein [Phycisphaerae bacterium]
MSGKNHQLPHRSRLAAAIITGALASMAHAQVPANWLLPVDGSWTDPTKWTTNPNYPNNGTPPGTTYNALVGITGASYTISLADPVSVSTLNISSPQATLALSGGTLSVTNRWTVAGSINHTAGAMNLTTGLLNVADLHGNAVYNHTGGTLNFGQYFEVGVLTNDTARYNISNSAVMSGGTLLVGANFGSGTVTQSSGTVQLTSQLDIADGVPTAVGHYQMDGGTLNLIATPGGNANLFFGTEGAGTFGQTGGTVVIQGAAQSSMVAGYLPASAGTYNMSGGTFQSPADVIGYQGAGTMLQSGGVHTVSGVMRIGRDLGGTGFYQLSGNAALISNGQVNVGSAGFGTFVQSGGTYTVNAPLIISANVLSRGRYTLSAGTLTASSEVISAAGAGTFDQTGGLHTVTGLLQNTTSGAGTYLLSGGTLNANSYASSGTFAQSGGVASFGTVNGTGTIAASGNGKLTGNYVRHGTVALSGNALITVRSNGTPASVSLINTLTFAGGATPSGTFDLTNNDLKVSNGDLATIQAQIRHARNGGFWNLPGITSSAAATAVPRNTTLGVLSGAEYNSVTEPDVFDGFAVAPTDVLVKYTYYGDTDFNGMVDFDDYSRIDAGFNNNRTGWFNGDVDYNGVVDFDDYSLIDQAFNTQSGTLRRAISYLDGTDRSDNEMNAPALQLVQQHFAQFGEGFATSFLNSVPEPTSAIAFAGLAASAARIRRRRSNRN